MVFYTVYKTTNKLNGKFYIGKHKTSNLDDGYLGSGKYLKYAIIKYGKENFQKEILHIFDNEDEMNAKEKELVVLGENSYNLCEGGQGGFGYINQNIELRIAKNKKAMKIAQKNGIMGKGGKAFYKKYKENPIWAAQIEVKRKNSMKKWGASWPGFSTFLGKKHSEETKQKIGLANSENQKGSKNSQYGTCWICHPELKLNKKIKKIEIDKYIDLGYIKGRF